MGIFNKKRIETEKENTSENATTEVQTSASEKQEFFTPNEQTETNDERTEFVPVVTTETKAESTESFVPAPISEKDDKDGEFTPVVFETLPDLKKGKKRDKKIEISFEGFDDLSTLTGREKAELIDESLFLQIKKIIARLGKVIVRYSITDAEFEKVLLNLDTLSADGIMISPVYISTCAKFVKKHSLQRLPVSAIIDFPNGESDFKSKLVDARKADRQGVDAVTVMMPVALTVSDKVKELKIQLNKLSSMCQGRVGVAFNASDCELEDLVRSVKYSEKHGVKRATLVFGSATLAEVLEVVNHVKGAVKSMRLDVLANVNSVEGVVELSKCGVGAVYTPFADDIIRATMQRFNIKSAKLV